MTQSPEGSDDRAGMMRLSHRLVALHVGGVVILILAVLSTVLWISREHNKLALETSQSLVRGGIDSFRARLRTLVKDYSIWDEAYAAAVAGDREWLYSNIGNAAGEIGTLDLIVFVDPATHAAYGWHLGSPPNGEPDPLPAPLLETILRLLDDPTIADSARTLLAEFGAATWAFSAARVTPVDGLPPGVRLEELPVQVHGMRLSADRLQQIGQNLLVDDLAIAAVPAPGQAAITLNDFSGRTISHVVWIPPRPGASILKQVALPLGLALLIAAIVSAVSSGYAVRSARSLERALHAAKVADRSKTEFLSNVSHELRTPMNGILGVAQLLQTTELDAEQRELVEVLFASANAQMALISDLLDFSRMESGNRQLVEGPFEPAGILKDLAEMIRVAADGKAIELACCWDPPAALSVIGDERAFRQIVTNLLGNAVKFTEHGRVTMEAQAFRGDDRARIVVRVTDTGRGIPAEALAHVFERFYQVDSSLTRSTEGTGLGLAISQNLARMMGGRIDVASEIGVGSTFTFAATFAYADTPRETLNAA